jgi:predicted Zn-dependent peptidase
MRVPSAVCALAAVLGIAVPGAPSARAATAPVPLKVEKTKLSNGLEVIFHEDHRTPIVAVNLWYHVGSKEEPAGKNGFAHLFEHVMFQGSKHVAEDTFFKYLEAAGATDVNGTTNADRTNYFETVPSNQLELALWLESDRMGFLLDHADSATFTSQRDVVKNERRQNYENAPYGLVIQFVREELFPADHPYHLLTIGTPRDLDNASLDDVRSFFRTWYVPNNATLTIAGDFDKKKALELVEKYFGPIPGRKLPDRAAPPLPKLAGETKLEVEADVELGRVYVSWPTPAFYAGGDAELDLFAHVLTSGKTSRLYKRLVYDLQIAQDVAASQQSMQYASVFEIRATAKPGKTPAELLKVIDEELSSVRTAGIKDDELARAKKTIVSQMIFDQERVGARANTINTYNHYTGDPAFFPKDVARYESATKDAVRDASVKLTPPGARVVTIVTPTKGAPLAGRLVRAQRPGSQAPSQPGSAGGAK